MTDYNDTDELEALAAASLESLITRNMEVALSTVESGEPSELVKDMQDMVLEIALIIALDKTSYDKIDRRTGLAYRAWNELAAANALGITHRALRSAAKRFGLEPPLPDAGQGNLFQDA